MAGAAGYVLKQIKGSDLVAAVRTVASGRSTLDPETTAHLLANLRRQRDPAPADGVRSQLTGRELEILDLIGDGMTNREIGATLFLAEKTVKNHISRILAKLGVERRVQAAMLAGKDRSGERGAHP
jgi:two-component system response regulator DevR